MLPVPSRSGMHVACLPAARYVPRDWYHLCVCVCQFCRSHDPPVIKICDFGFAKTWSEEANMFTQIG